MQLSETCAEVITDRIFSLAVTKCSLLSQQRIEELNIIRINLSICLSLVTDYITFWFSLMHWFFGLFFRGKKKASSKTTKHSSFTYLCRSTISLFNVSSSLIAEKSATEFSPWTLWKKEKVYAVWHLRSLYKWNTNVTTVCSITFQFFHCLKKKKSKKKPAQLLYGQNIPYAPWIW